MKRRFRTPLIKNQAAERAQFAARSIVAGSVAVLALLLLVSNYFRLQVLDHDIYAVKSENNRLKLRPLAPTRGLIFDRNGVLLAENQLAYRLDVQPDRVKDLAATLEELAPLINFTDEDRRNFEKEKARHRRFQAVPVKMRLSDDELARFAIDRHLFPGFEVVAYPSRHYPQGPLLAHVLGYVGRISEADEERLKRDGLIEDYLGTTHIGKLGVEAYYESLLHGEVGYEQVEINALGRSLGAVSMEPPKHGKDLYLSIDVNLQRAATQAMGEETGAVVAIDPRNGEVLALVSLPNFDPNPFVSGISTVAYAALNDDPLLPLNNRALRGIYPPGSTLKPFVGLAGLEDGVRLSTTRILSTGAFTLPGTTQRYRDWRVGGHGMVDLNEALAQSVNTYFYTLALDLGIDRMHDYLAKFGFGERTGIDLSHEAAGVLPSRDWKLRTLKQPWYMGETAVAGIGQGYNAMTPVQLAHATATLASGGVPFRPHTLRAIRGEHDADPTPVLVQPSGPSVIADPEHFAAVRRGMVSVMHGPSGTARAVGANSPYQMAGKSGTAQTFGLRGAVYREADVAKRLRHHALFVGFAASEAPTIALAVVVEHGGGGSRTAAPVARKVFDAWLVPGGVEAAHSAPTLEEPAEPESDSPEFDAPAEMPSDLPPVDEMPTT